MALQFFWLRKVYRDEEHGFRKETGFIFQNTVLELTDSALRKSIRPMRSDSSKVRVIRTRRGIDSVWFQKSESDLPLLRDSTANIQVFVSRGAHENDSLVRMLKPLMSHIREDRHERFFTIRLDADSVPVKAIHKTYKSNLAKADINIPFLLIRMEPPNSPILGIDSIDQDNLFLTPAGAFEITFIDLKWIIFKKIIPQILFALVLTFITISAFILLYRSLRSQQRLMEIKNDFINNMTHELKTPVATVSVAIEALQNFNVLDNPKLANEYLTIAQSELKRLTLMADKILKTSVFEKNGVDLHLENIDIHTMVTEVINSMELVAKKQDAIITFEKEGVDFTLRGSEEHLSNIFYNLIDNALKYSPEKPDIKIILKELSGQITFSIQDNGIGIPKTYQKKIFEKFFRVPQGDVHTTKGYGLGLSYVASVVKSHGGNVTVESEEGKGSRFVVVLPKRIGA
jgi:two-component system, OmpR family, phosphate regulon sensor histidine kinase PhoR